MIERHHAAWSARRRRFGVLGAAIGLTMAAAVIAAATAAPASARSRISRSAWRSAPTTTTTAPTTSPSTTVATPAATGPGAPGPTTSTTGPTQATTTTTVRPAPTAAAPTTTVPAPAASTAPTASSSGVLFGVATQGGATDLGGISAFERDAGKRVALDLYYASFAGNADFDTAAADGLRLHGATPLLTWEPWDPSSGSATQPSYTLASIVSGSKDAYLTRWAKEIKAWGHPLFLRFAHEMNANWYPWGAGVNGNTPTQYVAAWRHVHDLFVAAGATNVSWVWSPNVEYPGSASLSSLYPGDAYVDWVGVDGYNWGTTQSWGSTWQSFDQVFGTTISALRQVSSRPLMIAEVASTEVGGDKAAWITQFFASLAAHPDIRAFVWFNLNKETDWRIESSAAAQRAFAAGVADPRYRSSV